MSNLRESKQHQKLPTQISHICQNLQKSDLAGCGSGSPPAKMLSAGSGEVRELCRDSRCRHGGERDGEERERRGQRERKREREDERRARRAREGEKERRERRMREEAERGAESITRISLL